MLLSAFLLLTPAPRAQAQAEPAALVDQTLRGLKERGASAALEAAPSLATKTPQPRLPAGFLAVPLARQETDYSCGPAALLSALKYWQVFGGREKDLYPLLDTTPKDGTESPKLVAGARRFGLDAALKKNLALADLRAALARGATAILQIQAWPDAKTKSLPWARRWEDGHYVVLIAMDEHFAYVMDPSLDRAYGYLPLPELVERWHDYEDRHGFRQVYDHAAVFLSGRTPVKALPPPPLARVE